MKTLAKQLAPPILWDALARLKDRARRGGSVARRPDAPPDHQELDVYWTPAMAHSLEVWGEGNAWDEIQLLLANLRGTVLDIACGTGKTMELLGRFADLEVHGFDISDFLIQKANERGISGERLRVRDATRLDYDDRSFDYSYSIGSLEHFTEEGIDRFLAESRRVTRVSSFHQVPTSRSGRDEGWLTTVQSFHNNSVAWWLERYRRAFPAVQVLPSRWEDDISVGKWFLCRADADAGASA